jgi:hypothetical protein
MRQSPHKPASEQGCEPRFARARAALHGLSRRMASIEALTGESAAAGARAWTGGVRQVSHEVRTVQTA